MSNAYDIVKFCDIVKSNKYQFNLPNIIIHNAAIDPKPGADCGIDPFRRHAEIMKVNHTGVAHLNSLLIPPMIENGGGIIIIIGSIMGYVSANPDNYSDGWLKAFGYNESKAALQMHCHNINTVYGKRGIRCVMPSFGPFEQGLMPGFLDGFGKKIPTQKPVSKKDLLLTLKYCIECESLAGEFRVDGGYTRATNPFRQPDTIKRAWEKFEDNQPCDSIRAIEKCKQHPYKMWVVRPGTDDREFMLPMSGNIETCNSPYQGLPIIYAQTAALEIAWTNNIFEYKNVSGKLIRPFFMPELEGFDINLPLDWLIAEEIYNKRLVGLVRQLRC
jgi:hypothetical protein